MIAEHLLNPYDIPVEMEFPHTPHAEENWTEYHYFFAYDKDADIGLSLHIGRLAEDTSIWRGILYVFMPDDKVLVRKYAGRGETARGFSAGPLQLTCIEPFKLWSLDFDGAMQATTGKSMCYGPLQDGVDEVVKVHCLFEAATPFFSLDPNKLEGLPNMGWAHDHFEQIHTVSGEVTYAGKTSAFKGMGNRDHSSGPRDSGKVFGGIFFNVLFPSGKAISFTKVKAKTYDGGYGYMYWGDGTPLEAITVISTEELNDADTPENSVHPDPVEAAPTFTAIVGTSRGEQRMEVRRIRSVVTSYVPPHHEIAGTDYGRPDAAQQVKIAAVVTCDGEEGICQLDRYARIRTLKR